MCRKTASHGGGDANGAGRRGRALCGSAPPSTKGQEAPHHTWKGLGRAQAERRAGTTRATQQLLESSENRGLDCGRGCRAEGQSGPRAHAPPCARRQTQSCSERTTFGDLGKLTLTPKRQRALGQAAAVPPVVCASRTRSCCSVLSAPVTCQPRTGLRTPQPRWLPSPHPK